MNVWDEILHSLRARMPEEDFRRWFAATAYASDSGHQITVWVPTESIRRHIDGHYEEEIDQALEAAGRRGTHVRLVVGGVGDDEEDD
jgi:chromosomal replication initiation ATPase DnaA